MRRLLELVEENLRTGKAITEQQRHLAGLTRVQYLYVDDEQGDLILEGPAEDRWEAGGGGIVLGAVSKQPLLDLDDLAVAWRNASDGSESPSVSLESRPESRQRVAEAIRRFGHPATPAARRDFEQRLQEVWGEQDAVSGGVPQDSRFNKVLVDADWEMKRISLGHSNPGVDELPSYADLEFSDLQRRVLAAGRGARKPPGGSRFWFYPGYSAFARSEDARAVEIPDDAVRLLTESYFRTLTHARQVVPDPTPAARQFAQAFTMHYGQVAWANPIYAYLRNLFDWVAIARIVRLLDIPRRIHWDLALLRRGYPVRRVPTPRTMPGLVEVRHGQVQTAEGLADLVFPAWGGVAIDVGPQLRPGRWRFEPRLRRQHRTVLSARPVSRRAWSVTGS